MGEQIRVAVKPELLVWARKGGRHQVHEAAKKAKVPVERLTEWEPGDSSPTVNQLRTLANIYKRPLAVFFLPEPPRQFEHSVDEPEALGRSSRVLAAVSPIELCPGFPVSGNYGYGGLSRGTRR